MSNTNWFLSNNDFINIYDTSYNNLNQTAGTSRYYFNGTDLGSVFTLYSSLGSNYTGTKGTNCLLYSNNVDIGSLFVQKGTIASNGISISSNNVLSNCCLWLDASDSNTYTLSGSNITQLNDKSGLGSNTTAYYGTQPTFQTNTINGLPVFNCVNGGFLGNFSTTYTGNTFSFFMVVMFTGFSNFYRIIALGNNDTNNDSWVITKFVLTPFSSKLQMGRNNTVNNTSNVSINTPYLVSGYFDGTNEYLGLNGVYTSIASSGNFNINKYGLGVNTYNNGEIGLNKFGEVLMFQNTPSLVQRQYIEGYLAWKWGLKSNLPSSHPYYSSSIIINIDNSGVSNSNLVVYYPLLNDTYNYAKGTPVNDLTLYNGATISTSQSNFGYGSLYFNGSSQYANISSTTLQVTNNGLTIASWFNYTGGLSQARLFQFVNGVSQSNTDAIIYVPSQNYIDVFQGNSNVFNQTIGSSLSNGTWTHFAWTMTYAEVGSATSTQNVFINGVNVYSTNTGYYPNSSVNRNANFLGKSPWSSDPYATGYINEFRVYNRVLSSSEVTSLFNYKK